MGRPGLFDNQIAAEDTLLQLFNQIGTIQGSTILGTIVVGTVFSVGLGSVVGGFKGGTLAGSAIFQSRKFTYIQDAHVLAVPIEGGSVISAKVIAWGGRLGTLIGTVGTVMATILPAPNNILIQFYLIGTTAAGGQLNPAVITDASRLIGSVVAMITGK